MKKLLLAIPILLVLGVIGLKLVLISQVKSSIDKMVKMAAPFAKVTYTGIYTDFSGTVGIEGLTFEPYDIPDSITIEQSLIHFSSLLDLYRYSDMKALESGDFPKTFGFSTSGMKMDMAGEIAQFLYQNPESEFGYLRYIGALGCGQRSTFSILDFLEMGYSQLSSYSSFKYVFNETTQTITLTLNSGTDDMFGITLDADLFFSTDYANVSALIESDLLLSRLVVTFTDDSYFQRVMAFCTDQTQLSAEDYITQHTEQLTQQLAETGFQVNEHLQAAYARLLREAGSLVISLNPSSPVEFLSWEPMPLDTLVQWLNLRVAVNGDNVELVQAATSAQTPTPVIKPVKSTVKRYGPPDHSEVLNAYPTRQRTRKNYVTVPIADVSDFVNQKVRLTSQTGKTHSGVLTGVDGDIVSLKIRSHSGYVVYKVPKDKLKKLQVYQP